MAYIFKILRNKTLLKGQAFVVKLQGLGYLKLQFFLNIKPNILKLVLLEFTRNILVALIVA